MYSQIAQQQAALGMMSANPWSSVCPTTTAASPFLGGAAVDPRIAALSGASTSGLAGAWAASPYQLNAAMAANPYTGLANIQPGARGIAAALPYDLNVASNLDRLVSDTETKQLIAQLIQECGIDAIQSLSLVRDIMLQEDNSILYKLLSGMPVSRECLIEDLANDRIRDHVASLVLERLARTGLDRTTGLPGAAHNAIRDDVFINRDFARRVAPFAGMACPGGVGNVYGAGLSSAAAAYPFGSTASGLAATCGLTGSDIAHINMGAGVFRQGPLVNVTGQQVGPFGGAAFPPRAVFPGMGALVTAAGGYPSSAGLAGRQPFGPLDPTSSMLLMGGRGVGFPGASFGVRGLAGPQAWGASSYPLTSSARYF